MSSRKSQLEFHSSCFFLPSQVEVILHQFLVSYLFRNTIRGFKFLIISYREGEGIGSISTTVDSTLPVPYECIQCARPPLGISVPFHCNPSLVSASRVNLCLTVFPNSNIWITYRLHNKDSWKGCMHPV